MRRGRRFIYHGQAVVRSHGQTIWQADDLLIGVFFLRNKRVGAIREKNIGVAFRNMRDLVAPARCLCCP